MAEHAVMTPRLAHGLIYEQTQVQSQAEIKKAILYGNLMSYYDEQILALANLRDQWNRDGVPIDVRDSLEPTFAALVERRAEARRTWWPIRHLDPDGAKR